MTVEYTKKGRAVTGVEFRFARDIAKKVARKNNSDGAGNDSVNLQGLSLEDVEAACEKFGRDKNSAKDLELSAKQLIALREKTARRK